MNFVLAVLIVAAIVLDALLVVLMARILIRVGVRSLVRRRPPAAGNLEAMLEIGWEIPVPSKCVDQWATIESPEKASEWLSSARRKFSAEFLEHLQFHIEDAQKRREDGNGEKAS